MKRLLPILIVVISLSVTSGCFKKSYPWSFNINSSYVTSTVYSSIFGSYPADPGYKWRVLNVSVTNNLSYTQRLNPFIYKFSLRPEGTSLYYDNQLNYYGINNELSWDDVQPHQTITGEIYFELPDAYAYSACTVWLINTLATGSEAKAMSICSYVEPTMIEQVQNY